MKFSRNETIGLMHESEAMSFRKIADHIEKWQMDWKDVVEFLREMADVMEAQAVVANLRDELNPPQ